MLDLILRGGDAGALLAAVWAIVWATRKISRQESLMRDFPPHRHTNGTISYSPDYPPPMFERLHVGQGD